MCTNVLLVFSIVLTTALTQCLCYEIPRILASRWQNLKSSTLRPILKIAAIDGDNISSLGSESDLVDLVTLLEGTIMSKKSKKSGSRKKRRIPTFKRTTRVDGLKVWVKELSIIQERDISKEG